MRHALGIVLTMALTTAACSGATQTIECPGEAIPADLSTGRACAYAVVEGGFSCPPHLPVELVLPGGGRICAPGGTGPADVPQSLCQALGERDCSGLERHRPMSDGGAPRSGADAGQDAGTGGAADAGRLACDMMQPAPLEGTSPFGALDLTLTRVAAADCGNTFTPTAWVEFRGARGEQLSLSVRYRVVGGPPGRSIEEDIVADATLEWTDASGMRRGDTAAVRIVVSDWREGAGSGGAHTIDAVLTFEDTRFAVEPVQLRGTFCEWQALIC